jgi:hypothetical protein
MAFNAQSKTLIVDLHIPSEEYLRHYQGHVSQVSCTARDGRKVRFPSKILQKYVTHEGIRGTFAIHFDEHHKFVEIDKIS